MEREKLILMGSVALQQQLHGAPRWQGDAGGGEPAAEAARRPARLWQQLAVVLWRHELTAHSHLWNLLHSARCTYFYDLEQVGHDSLRAACPWLCGHLELRSPRAAAADGPVSTGVAIFERDEDMPLRKGRRRSNSKAQWQVDCELSWPRVRWSGLVTGFYWF